jgi:hypothetical protein
MHQASVRFAIAAIAISTALFAQEFRGTLLGRITDPSGAVIPGATIKARNTATNVTLESNSNESGNFQIPFVTPGDYSVTVASGGFKTSTRNSIRVSLGAQVTIDFTLEVGQAAESITVDARPPLLNTASADLGQVVSSTEVVNIPVSITRNVMDIASLSSNVLGGGGGYTSNSQTDMSISGGGSSRGGNEVMIDGIPNTVAQGSGNIVYVPSMDSVEEVKIHTTLFDASLGHSSGGAINITTKGGTNELHGTAYLFKRWKALNANSWQNNRLNIERAPVNYNQWGFVVGGPLLLPKIYNGRNRTFFSAAVERNTSTGPSTRQGRVPSELERQGDFSQTRNRLGGVFTLFDPNTTVVTGSTATRQPFPGNRIPANRLDPFGRGAMNLFPVPTTPGETRINALNWAKQITETTEEKQYSLRMDHLISDKQRLFGRISKLVRDQIPIRSFPTEYREGGGGDYIRRDFYSAALDDTFTISPTLVGSLRYGFSRRTEFTSKGGYGLDVDVPIPAQIAQNQYLSGLPILRLGENMLMVGSGYRPEANDSHALLATFTKIAGSHNLKFGADWRVMRKNNSAVGTAGTGDFTFNPLFSQADPFNVRSSDTSGTAMASVLLGLPNSGSLGFTSPLSMQHHYLAGFVQDDWKATKRLTLNFGVRYELETPWTERYNRVSYGFDQNASFPVQIPGSTLQGGIQFAGVGDTPRHQGRIDGNNFGPRIGFAYQVAPRTVVRGGYGMFFAGQSFSTGFLGTVGAFDANTPYVGSLNGGATPFASFANPFPNGLRQPLGSSAGLMAQAGDSLSFFDDRRVSPYNQQWQFSIQRELPASLLLEATYMGMLSLKQFEAFNLNEKPDSYLALGAQENTQIPNPFLNLLPPTSTLGQGNTIPQRRLWTAYPQFTDLTIQGANTGRAIYHAFQLRADKRLSHGLTAIVNYTLSKVIDNNTTSIVNPRNYRAVSQFDKKHVLRIGTTYQVASLLTSKGMASKVVNNAFGGWLIGAVMSIESGFPLAITDSVGRPVRLRTPSKSGEVSDRLGDVVVNGVVQNPYFDTTAFQRLNNQFVISPESPVLDDLRGPGVFNLNLAVTKRVQLREKMRLELRGEAVGATNTPNFGNPGTNISNAGTFGVITSAGGARQMQMSVRFVF